MMAAQRLGLTATLLACAIPAAAPAAADGVRVATFNVAAGQPTPQPAPAPPAAPAFRHTFGAERRQPEQQRIRTADTSGVGADVFLLQGISDAAAIRRLFPVNAWTIVLSRQLIDRTRQEPMATTGIVVRHSETTRVVQREHFLPLRGGASAATAVQLRNGASLIWLVSIDLDATCLTSATSSAASCAGVPSLAEALTTWIGQKLAEGQPVVLGGPATSDLGSRIPKNGTLRADRRTMAAGSPPPAASAATPISAATTDHGLLLAPPQDGPCRSGKASTALHVADPSAALAVAARGWAVPIGGNAQSGSACILALDYTDARADPPPAALVTRADRR